MPASKDPHKYPAWMMQILMEDRGNKELFRITLPRKKATSLRSQFYGFLSAITNSSGFTAYHPRARELTTRLDYHPDDTVTLTVVDRDLDIDPRIEAALADMVARRPANSTPIIHYNDPTLATPIPSSLPSAPSTPSVMDLLNARVAAMEEPLPPEEPTEPIPISKPIRTEVEQRTTHEPSYYYRFDLLALIERMPGSSIPYWLIDLWKLDNPDACVDKPTFMKIFQQTFQDGSLAKWWEEKRTQLIKEDK